MNRFAAAPLPLLLAAIGGLALLRERRRRRTAERLAAATMESLLNAIDATDAETGAHVRRVARYALVIADAVGLDPRERQELERIALFHDIGKIHEALYDIIHDDERLSPADRRAVITHPRRGAQVLAPLSPFYPRLTHGVIAHHERWDGTGYPRGLARTQIPLLARIISVADSFDVVAHGRRYRPGTGAVSAARIIAEGRGTQFDPDLVDLLLLPPILRQFKAIHRAVYRRPTMRKGGDSRVMHTAVSGEVPEISFRWRTRAAEPSVVSAARRADG